MLTRAGVATDGIRLAYLLMNAELDGVICSGGLAGRRHTYALLDERAPGARILGRDDALAELVLRYFTSHGPATAKDFRWWSSLTATDTNRGLDMVAPPSVHLLQTYDEYIVGYRESRYALDTSGVARSLPGGRAVFNHVVVLDSQVAGHWKRTVKRDSVVIEVALHTPFDDAQQQALRDAADRHAEFLGLPATVVTTALGHLDHH